MLQLFLRSYIQDQERADILQDKMSVKEYEDPFGAKPGRHKEKASAFRRLLVTRAYSSHPEPPVLRVGAMTAAKKGWEA